LIGSRPRLAGTTGAGAGVDRAGAAWPAAEGLAARLASTSPIVKVAHAIRVAAIDVAITEAWALLLLRAAALDFCTFFLIAGSGLFAYRDGIACLFPVFYISFSIPVDV
jgi:hypothetical protein